MEIAIQRDEKHQNVYTITINQNIITIQTVWAQARKLCCYPNYEDDLIVKQWVREIKRVYGKKKNQTLIIGLSADRSTNYAKGNTQVLQIDNNVPKNPYELLQLCVGNHCLIYEPHVRGWKYDENTHVPKALRDLLSANHTIVVGVKINEVAKKLENECGLIISRPVDLRVLAGEAKGDQEGGYYSRYGLEKLAKVVLGEEWDMAKPASMKWWEVDRRTLSDDKIKYGTVEAFLAYQMGLKLLKDS